MKVVWALSILACAAVPARPAHAQEPPMARGTGVCIHIDTARDMLAPSDRVAAQLLVARQFELAGARVVAGDCTESFALSHVTLGRTITVALVGPHARREAAAMGLDDLPAVYSQMVRSIVSGRPMTAAGVVDRTNVAAAQAAPRRQQADSFGYSRLGFSGLFGSPDVHGAASIGFGYRAELDRFAVDLSFFNSQIQSSADSYPSSAYSSGHAMTGSVFKLEGLHFLHPAADASLYVGGGLSWGLVDVSSGTSPVTYTRGSGLQAELTLGYELARASTLRLFVQADATLPFQSAQSQTTTYTKAGASTTSASHYLSSVTVSVGIGWQRGRR